MYPNDQSISSYSSNPSTPVNSPPPLTQTPGTSLIHNNSTPSTSWQQLTPANVVLNNPPVLNGQIQNGQYASELVHRGLHMVIITHSLHCVDCLFLFPHQILLLLINFFECHFHYIHHSYLNLCAIFNVFIPLFTLNHSTFKLFMTN